MNENNKIFKIIDDNTLEHINSTTFHSEKYLQMLIINNIEEVFELQLVDYEFNPGFGNNRFDCVLFNPKKKVFIIVEFKNKKDTRVTNQIFNYLDDIHMYPHKLINTYNMKYNKNFDEKYFNLSKTEILIVGTEFTERQSRSFICLYKELGERFNVMYAKNIENKYIILTDFFSSLKETNSKFYINSVLGVKNIELAEIQNKANEKDFKISNILLNSRISLSLRAYRILYYLLYCGYNSKIDYLDKEFEVHLSEIDKFYDLKGEILDDIQIHINSLKNLVVNNLHTTKNTSFKVFDYINITSGESVIKVSFSHEFMNSYNDSTMINLNNIKYFNSKYSFSFYHLIIKEASNKISNNIFIEINYLKAILGLENKYINQFSNFRIRVLNPVFENLKHISEFKFKYKGINKIKNKKNIKVFVKAI